MQVTPVAAIAQSGIAAATLKLNASASNLANANDTSALGAKGYQPIQVNNTADSVAFGTFWYGWVPGAFYLGTDPATVTPASGWTYSIQVGSPAGYSIEFNTSTALLQPGASTSFEFTSSEAPSTLYGSDANESYVYTGSAAFSGSGEQVNVTAVPEPSSIALMLTGVSGLWFARRKT